MKCVSVVYKFIKFTNIVCERDGTQVTKEMLEYLEWDNNYPNNADEDATCVVWRAKKLKNTRCGLHKDAPGGASYYDVKYWKIENFTTQNLHRGYLCEARPIHTVSKLEKTGGELCHFPFRLLIYQTALVPDPF